MAVHFSWMNHLPGVDHHSVHVATAAVASGLMILVGLYARAKLGKGEKAVLPAAGFSVRGIFELIIEFITSLCEQVIGHGGRKFAPLCATFFFMVLFNNLLGLIPGMSAATDNINSTLALGLMSFIVYNAFGLKEGGFSYLKHFLGPVLALAPIMLVIELISHLVRPLTLGLRLMGNIQGDHAVLAVFHELAPIGVPVIFYFMGLFVAFMQAFIFTVLSMVYISLAIAHDH